jgi:hypothetical protein
MPQLENWQLATSYTKIRLAIQNWSLYILTSVFLG